MARGYSNGKQIDVDLVQIDKQGHELSIPAAVAFIKMRAAAKMDLIDLEVNRAFASMEQQERLYKLFKAGKGAPANKPGWSVHQRGDALDIDVKDARGSWKPSKAWLDKNAERFGWKPTHPKGEPWHFEYVGVE
jgi:LAS superfamily LD-carboxypeptidase LdcB